MIDLSKKWRSVVDGDTWHFVRNVLGGMFQSPMLGVSHNGNEHTVFYNHRKSKIECKFRLDDEEFDQFESHLKECHEKSIEQNSDDWINGKFVIREVKTKHDAVIHMCSMNKGSVNLKFVLYDTKGEDYCVCSIGASVILDNKQTESFLAERTRQNKKL